MDYLISLEDQDGFDYWSLTKLQQENAIVMVDQKHQDFFEKSLVARKMKFDVLVEDLEKCDAIEWL